MVTGYRGSQRNPGRDRRALVQQHESVRVDDVLRLPLCVPLVRCRITPPGIQLRNAE